MIQQNTTQTKGVLQAYSEKNGGVLIGNKWYSTANIPVSELATLKRKAIVADVSEDGRYVTRIELDATAPAPAPMMRRSFNGGRSEEESKRISRQACLNTAATIYDLALRTTAGTFNTPASASTADVAEAIKAEVMRIAADLEGYVYR
jgi:hypothetical protein